MSAEEISCHDQQSVQDPEPPGYPQVLAFLIKCCINYYVSQTTLKAEEFNAHTDLCFTIVFLIQKE